MQNQNNFIDFLTQFLKSNNINYQDVFNQFFNINNNISKSEEVVKYKVDEDSKDEDMKSMNEAENEYDYELLINKLDNIQNNINKLLLEISKNN